MFKDLAEKDMDVKGMEVICQIVRRGKMLLDDRKGSGTHLRRPYAYGGECVWSGRGGSVWSGRGGRCVEWEARDGGVWSRRGGMEVRGVGG